MLETRRWMWISLAALLVTFALVLSGCGGGGAPAPGSGGQNFPLGGGGVSVQVVNPANLQVISFTPRLSGGGEMEDPGIFLGFWGTDIELLGLNLELPGGTWTIPYLSVINGDIYTSVGPWFEKFQLVQVTNTADYEMHPVWSPRARKIAFVLNGELCTMNADGSKGLQITATGGLVDRRPEWSPDGNWIAYTVWVGPGNTDLWITAPDGSVQQPVTAGVAHEFDPTWMPNSQLLVFAKTVDQGVAPDLWETNLSGTVQKNLTNTAQVSETQPMVDTEAEAVVYVVGEEEPTGPEAAGVEPQRAPPTDIWRWDFDSNDLRTGSSLDVVGPTQLTFTSWDQHPSWDATGDFILFESQRDEGGQSEIYVMEDWGAAQTNLTWSSDWDEMPYWKGWGYYHISIGGNKTDSGYNPPLSAKRDAALACYGSRNGWFGSVGIRATAGGIITLTKVEQQPMIPLIDVMSSTYLVITEDLGRGTLRRLHTGATTANPRIPGWIQRAIVAMDESRGTIAAIIPFAGGVSPAAEAGAVAPLAVEEAGDGVVLKGDFAGVDDSANDEYTSGPFSEVVLDANGKVVSYR